FVLVGIGARARRCMDSPTPERKTAHPWRSTASPWTGPRPRLRRRPAPGHRPPVTGPRSPSGPATRSPSGPVIQSPRDAATAAPYTGLWTPAPSHALTAASAYDESEEHTHRRHLQRPGSRGDAGAGGGVGADAAA